MENTINQCDGCRSGYELVNGLHRDNGRPFMVCTRSMYREPLPTTKAILSQARQAFLDGRMVDLEGILTGDVCLDAINGTDQQIQSLTNKISALEESLSIALNAAKSNWDSYQMEVLKTEKLSAENVLQNSANFDWD